jgi:hypothetical protein
MGIEEELNAAEAEGGATHDAARRVLSGRYRRLCNSAKHRQGRGLT